MHEPALPEAVIDSMASPGSTSVERLFEAYVEGVEGDEVDRLRRLGRALAAVVSAPEGKRTVADGR